ncbi:hypothetical protein [Granulibacter bethesdensis]|uniref:hypothetical protein n=1 Tax=Granulibacter bethesdensis TaxID=364410 RepID=UPI0012FDAAB6|nr:hypothetical protein [Granulibacter bethesdensis]
MATLPIIVLIPDKGRQRRCLCQRQRGHGRQSTVVNQGTIVSSQYGIHTGGNVSITNSGTISATLVSGAAIFLNRMRNGVVVARYCARRVVDGMLLDNIRQTLMEQVASPSIAEPEKDSA